MDDFLSSMFPGMMCFKRLDKTKAKWTIKCTTEKPFTIKWKLNLPKGNCCYYGGFGEDRTNLLGCLEPMETKMIHLGIDIYAGVGSRVNSICCGKVVYVFQDPSKINGWGHMVIIRDKKHKVYHLYGHLEVFNRIQTGSELILGQPLGIVASQDKNGGWPPHVHYQIMDESYVNSHHLWFIDGYSEQMPKGVLDPCIFWDSEGFK